MFDLILDSVEDFHTVEDRRLHRIFCGLAGGVKLDTMFVDEGFGSLDEESLDQAMKALSSLADGNRLVGIISHVADLKNRIDKQIVVEKEKSGGSKACIVL